ncbi:MAG TPA: O-antigen ligase family protein [Opitutaceae bacterium]|nr:O-antigen ligase family protein [Opitutaceae bacterium]
MTPSTHGLVSRAAWEASATAPEIRQAPARFPLSALASFLAGALTSFTVSLGGEMPLGEIILALTAGWAVLCVIFNQCWPGPLCRSRLLWTWLAAQLVALCSYVFSDLYRHSFPRDMARGWSRMIFLAVDIFAVAYLFGRSRRNFLWFLSGQCAGDVASAVILGPLFGDLWKFGIGAPLTVLLFWLAPAAGRFAMVVAAGAAGVLHFALDYRSFGGLCLLAGMLILLHMVPRRSRLWLVPLGTAAVAVAVFWTYGHTRSRNEERTTRSDVERSAMATAAIEAIESSPLIGHGSWFSNSHVYDNFELIRRETAREAHVGGFPDSSEDPGTTALHSQILVALAEGGLFGGAFFLVFGASLLRALYQTVFVRRWHRLAPLCILLLLSALWNLFFSPFSGAHRVYIAMACGLMLLLHEDRLAANREEAADGPA